MKNNYELEQVFTIDVRGMGPLEEDYKVDDGLEFSWIGLWNYYVEHKSEIDCEAIRIHINCIDFEKAKHFFKVCEEFERKDRLQDDGEKFFLEKIKSACMECQKITTTARLTCIELDKFVKGAIKTKKKYFEKEGFFNIEELNNILRDEPVVQNFIMVMIDSYRYKKEFANGEVMFYD